jgi:nitroreductase
MNVIEAIRTRRTIHSCLPDILPLETLEWIIEAGTWAPNHHMTQPWRFTIVGQKTRQAMADLYAEIQAASLPIDADAATQSRTLEKAREKALMIPNLIVVTCVMDGSIEEQAEDFAAACAAVQNMQLAAWSEGIGTLWSTGRITRLPALHDLIGLKEGQDLVGFLYLGYPAETTEPRPRKPVGDITRILP